MRSVLLVTLIVAVCSGGAFFAGLRTAKHRAQVSADSSPNSPRTENSRPAKKGPNRSAVPVGLGHHHRFIQSARTIRDLKTDRPDSLWLISKEWDPESAKWRSWSQPEVAAFLIQRIRARIANDVFVLGEEHGMTKIERWQFVPPEGGNHAKRPIAPPLGTPYPGDVVTTVEVRGNNGVWLAPKERDRATASSKRSLVLHRDRDNPIRTFEVDPDGRYLVFTDAVGIQQLDLRDPFGTPSRLLHAWETLDPDARDLSSLNVLHSSSKGRVIIGRVNETEFYVDYILVLRDADNDGLFDDLQEYQHEEYRAAYPRAKLNSKF